MNPVPPNPVISESEWISNRLLHEQRVELWIQPQLDRRSRHEKHPVHDFLFEYYSFRPSQLRRWSPGPGVTLGGGEARVFLEREEFSEGTEGVFVDVGKVPASRMAGLRWTLSLLQAVNERPAQFSCHGLHEWAMVYRSAEVRHQAWPLRLGQDGTSQVVESMPLLCTHYDAYRFFTPEAAPLNMQSLDRDSQPLRDQSGCIHVNMDLYKWAYKLSPWIDSALIADAFELALSAREIDMRASPYDLRALGYEPIAIETEDGRKKYREEQRRLQEAAEPLRGRLIEAYKVVLEPA